MSSTSATHIMVGRRRVRRFIHHPKPVNDGTVRCLACGQIDEPGYHDVALCPATSADVSDLYAVVPDPANAGAWQVRAPEGFLVFTTETCGPQTLKEAQKTAAISNGELAKREGETGSQAVTFDLVQHLHRQRAFSERTFGPGARTTGVIDHIRKELREIEAAPTDISEWIDVVLLALDGAWRSGASPEAIVAALLMKQTRNEARTWPDWRTADPNKAIEHDRSGEAPAAVGELKADFTRSHPSGMDDCTYEQIENALDRADAPINGPDRKFLTLAQRVDALRAPALWGAVEALKHYRCSCEPGHCAMSADDTDTPVDEQMCGRRASKALIALEGGAA